jgi:hypothetical protein
MVFDLDNKATPLEKANVGGQPVEMAPLMVLRLPMKTRKAVLA